jgi:hypothetical protein
MDLQAGRQPADSPADMPTPDFVVYGLADWDGARCVERWSQAQGRTLQLALGFGRRWDLGSGWFEVATFRPPPAPGTAARGTRLTQETTTHDRIAMELADLGTYGVLPADEDSAPPLTTTPGAVLVDRTAYEGTVACVDPVCCLDVETEAGSRVRVTWYGDPGRALPALEPVADLDPFVAGTERDQQRRRELFARR